jgi:hypothetical protein
LTRVKVRAAHLSTVDAKAVRFAPPPSQGDRSMTSIRWPTRLADAGALACAGALFVAIALELPARAESPAPESSRAVGLAATPPGDQAPPRAAPRPADVARPGG